MKNLNFNPEKMLFRCSSLHRLMGNAKSIDESLLTEEIESIKKITAKKRSSEQQRIIDIAMSKTLSETAKTLVKEMIRQEVHGANYKFQGSKETEKGHEVEDSAILFLMQQEFISAKKNTTRYKNEWLSGEPDIISNGIVYDTKCPWSYWSMPIFKDDIQSKSIDAGYDWQQLGYIFLLNDNGIHVDKAYLKYILMPTPIRLITKFDDHTLHTDFVESMSNKDRIRTYEINNDPVKIELIKTKITMARQYAKTLLTQL